MACLLYNTGKCLQLLLFNRPNFGVHFIPWQVYIQKNTCKMKTQIILHITELLLATIYLVIKWPFYEGDEYLSNFVYCAVYIILLIFYCSISTLVPAMKLACEFYREKDITIKKYFFPKFLGL